MNQDIKKKKTKFPKGFFKFWDNFNKSLYEEYLKKKELWRAKQN